MVPPRNRRSIIALETALALAMAAGVLLVLQAMQTAIPPDVPPTPTGVAPAGAAPRTPLNSVLQIVTDFAAVNKQAADGTITEQEYRAACQRLAGRLATIRRQLDAEPAGRDRLALLGALSAMAELLGSGAGPPAATADAALSGDALAHIGAAQGQQPRR
jgi:hypothetical protein